MAAKQRPTTRKKTATKSAASATKTKKASSTRRAGASKTAAKKPAAKKPATRKPSAKKATKKPASKASKKAATRKSPATKGASKKAAKKTASRKTTSKKAAPKKAASKKTSTPRTAVDRVESIRPTRAKTKTTQSGRTTKAKSPMSQIETPEAHAAVGSSAITRARGQAKEAPKPTEASEAPESNEPTTEELWVRYRAEVDRLAAAGLDDQPELPSGRPAAARNKLGSPELEEIRNGLIERYHPLVRYIAERLLQTLPKSIELDDLISAGLFGLMDAIRGFDPDRGIKFKTYCSTRIRGSILDQLRSQDWVPRLVRLKAGRIEKALQQLTGEFGREPTHAELAKVLEMEHTELTLEMRDSQAKTMFSLSEKWDDEDDGSIEKVEILEDHDAIDPVQELNRRDLMRFITRALTHKERFIIEQYYQYGHTMREIGEMLTLTESRVCQIHSNVMNRLKDLLDQRTDTLTQ